MFNVVNDSWKILLKQVISCVSCVVRTVNDKIMGHFNATALPPQATTIDF
jgi:hypothetical protein